MSQHSMCHEPQPCEETLEAMPANRLQQRNFATLRVGMAEAVKYSDVA